MRAQTLLDETLPRLAKLTIVVEAPAGARYQVSVDGNALPGALVGVSRPIDPGEHQVAAIGEGLEPVNESITLPEGEEDSLTLTLLPAQTTDTPAAVAPVAPVAATPAPTQPPPDSGTSASNRGMRIAGVSALAVGGLGIIAGSAFGRRTAAKGYHAPIYRITVKQLDSRPQPALGTQRHDQRRQGLLFIRSRDPVGQPPAGSWLGGDMEVQVIGKPPVADRLPS